MKNILFVLHGPSWFLSRRRNSVTELHVIALVHVVDGIVDDVRKALTQSSVPWDLSTELIMTLP